VTPEQRRTFIAAHAVPTAPPLVPEVTLLEGGDSMTLWEAAALTDMRPAVPPPYWAWPWAGGQALARYVLDHPELVRGRVAADIGTGGGVVAIAAALAGATRVAAIDIEPFAIEACRLNAAANGVAAIVDPIEADPTNTDDGWDVVLVGDLWYESEVSRRIEPWLRSLARRGATVLTGDLGRAYLPTDGLETLATGVVPTTVDLEDTTSKAVRVLRILPG
jgi:predicted nicotinamide N-methyase